MKMLCCEFIHSIVKGTFPRSRRGREEVLGSTKVGEKNRVLDNVIRPVTRQYLMK